MSALLMKPSRDRISFSFRNMRSSSVRDEGNFLK